MLWKLCLAVGLVVLVFLSVPKYKLFECRSTQSEAKAWLQHLYEAEKFYYAYHQSYASLEMLIGVGLIKSREIHYAYRTESFDAKHFRIIAKFEGDEWSVDQTGEIKAIHDACKVR